MTQARAGTRRTGRGVPIGAVLAAMLLAEVGILGVFAALGYRFADGRADPVERVPQGR